MNPVVNGRAFMLILEDSGIDEVAGRGTLSPTSAEVIDCAVLAFAISRIKP